MTLADQLAEIRRRCDANTSHGTYVFGHDGRGPFVHYERDTNFFWRCDVPPEVWHCDDPEDGCSDLAYDLQNEGEFLAAAATNLPAMLAWVEEAAAVLKGEIIIDGVCICCGRNTKHGHFDDCKIGRLLSGLPRSGE